MSENHREPEVPEEEFPVEECFDCPSRVTSKEFAPIRSVKSGTLQNACSTRRRVVADLVKSARMHIVRLMNNLEKRSKKNDDKSAVAMLKKNVGTKMYGNLLSTVTKITRDRGDLI